MVDSYWRIQWVNYKGCKLSYVYVYKCILHTHISIYSYIRMYTHVSRYMHIHIWNVSIDRELMDRQISSVSFHGILSKKVKLQETIYEVT